MNLNHQKLHSTVEKIVPYLPGWKSEPFEDSWYCNLTGQDKRKLYLEVIGPRLVISGCYPRASGSLGEYVLSGENLPRITVSLDRHPGQIAKEITRRLLPEYEEYYQLALSRIASREAYQDKTNESLDKLVEVIGVRLPHMTEETYINQDGLYGGFRVCGDSISLKINGLTIEQALRISYILYL